MGIVKMFYSFQWRKSTLVKNKVATAFRSSSREVFTEIMFVEFLRNYARKPVLESLF